MNFDTLNEEEYGVNSESPATQGLYPRALIDTVQPDDTTGGLQKLSNMTFSATVDVYNEPGRSKIMELSAGDAITLLEEIVSSYIPGSSGPVVNTITKEDTLTIFDEQRRVALRYRVALDVLTMADAALLARLRAVMTTDNLSLFDTLLRFVLRRRLFTEAFDVVDDFVKSIVGAAVQFRTASDTITLDDTRRFAYYDVIFDNLLRTTEQAIVSGQPRRLSRTSTEELTVSDLGVPGRTRRIEASDFSDVDDSGRNRFFDVVFGDAVTLLDFIVSGAGPVLLIRTAEDTFVMTDGTVRMTLRGRTLLEVAILADQSLRSRYVGATFADAIGLLDTATQQRIRGRIASETLTLAEALVIYRMRHRELSETLVLFEQVLGGATSLQIKTLTDLLDLSDAAILRMMKVRTQGETLTFDDSLARTALRGRLTAESLTLLEQLVASRQRTRFQADAVTVSDQSPRSVLRNRVLLDLISMDDSFIRMLRKTVTITDFVELVDALLSSTTGIRVVTVTEALALVDSLVLSRLRNRTVQELTSLTELVLRSVYRQALREEAITTTDLATMVKRLRRDYAELLTVTDEALVAYAFAVIHETRIRLGYEDSVELGVDHTGMPIVGWADLGIVLGGYNQQ